MISYNSKEFETMQQEAIRRVREMQKKAQGYVAQEEPTPNLNSKGSTSTNKQEQRPIKNTPQQINQPHNPAHDGSPRDANKNSNSHQNNSEKSKPMQNNHQNSRSKTSNPFAQLFGSNLGGFNTYKKNAQNSKDENMKANTGIPASINSILKDFAIDDEKLILLLLIYILYKNGADMKLVLALGYLLI